MNAAILCSGPSLSLLEETPNADTIIGVNRAVMAHFCDWWAVSDYQTVQEVGSKKLGLPCIFTTKASAAKLGLNGETRFEDINSPPRSGIGAVGWSLFSATAAMALAYHLGARRIDVYGADMAGLEDYDGCIGCRDNRTNSRWSTEKGIVNQLLLWMRERGVELNGIPE